MTFSTYGTVDEENSNLLPLTSETAKEEVKNRGVVWSTRVTAAVLCVLSIGVLISSAGRDISELTKNSNSELASVAKPNVIFVMVDDAGWGTLGTIAQILQKRLQILIDCLVRGCV